MNWTPVVEAINGAKQIVLLPHIYADGDALGSCGALAIFLRELGKQVTIVTEEAVMGKLSFLSTEANVDFVCARGSLPEAELALAVDVSDGARLGSRKAIFDRAPLQVRIDHHAVSGDFSPVTVCNPEWAATAEGIYELLEQIGCQWKGASTQAHRDMAVCIYTALMTDTGCFAYSNVTEQTLLIAAQMRRIAGDLSWIYRRVFENKTKSCIALTALAYAGTEYYAEGKIAYLCLTAEDYRRASATEEDSEGFSAMLRAIEGVHVSVFVREGRQPGQWRLSLRSDEACDVAKAAAEFGGGGHARAAGITYTPDTGECFEQFKVRLLNRLKESITL